MSAFALKYDLQFKTTDRTLKQLQLVALSILEGALMMMVPAVDEDGHHYGYFNDNTQHVFGLLSLLWQEMVLAGRITQVRVNTIKRGTI